MDFRLSEEQEAIRGMAEAFAAEELAPHAVAWEQGKIFPAEHGAYGYLAEYGIEKIIPRDLSQPRRLRTP